MITNPHLGLPTEGGWAMGFAWGYLGPAFSEEPPAVIAPEQMDAFNEGTLVGQQMAIEGLPVDQTCISLEREPSPGVEVFLEGVHVIEALDLLRAIFIAEKFAEAGAGAFVAAFRLAIPGPPPFDPVSIFQELGLKMREQLVGLGIDSGSMFIAAGLDESIQGCEMLLTPIFKSQDSAREAAQALGRPNWFVAQWDASAPMSSSFVIIESGS
jgi:hypothetical protein